MSTVRSDLSKGNLFVVYSVFQYVPVLVDVYSCVCSLYTETSNSYADFFCTLQCIDFLFKEKLINKVVNAMRLYECFHFFKATLSIFVNI